MKTLLLPLATAVLGIAVGFFGGKAFGDGGGRDVAEERGPAARQYPSRSEVAAAGADGNGQPGTVLDREAEAVLSGFLKGRSVTEISGEEVLALLGPELGVEGTSDPVEWARANYQYRLLAARLPLDVMEGVLAQARGKGVHESHVIMLFAGYAERDPDRAMAWAETQPGVGQLRAAAISRLSLTDPARAAELYREELLTGGGSGTFEMTSTLAASQARRGAAEFFRFYDDLPVRSRPNLLTNGSRTLSDEDVPGFLAEIRNRVDDGRENSLWMDQVIISMTRSHPAEIRKWLATMEPGGQRALAEVNLARGLSRQGKADEVDGLLRSAMAGSAGEEKEFLREHARNLVWHNPEVLEHLVNLLPEGQELTAEDVRGWSRPDYPVQTVLIVAKYLRSPEEQAAFLVENLGSLGDGNRKRKVNERDFQILSHRLETMDLSADAVAQGKAALESARWKVMEGKR